MSTPYDEVPYSSLPYAETHPDRLRLVAHLFHLAPAPVERCRVLEIGCSAGGNLIPMAEALPESRFLGVDLAATAVAAGQDTVRALGLANIELRHLDLVDFPRDAGEFDYILCHGVYSWVPDPVKAALLDLVGRHLAPDGVAYISHNVKPGWFHRVMAREMMQIHSAGTAEPHAKLVQSRALIEFVAEHADDKDFKGVVGTQNEIISRQPDWLLYHDYLGAVNDGCWFHEMVEELGRRGLAFLGDADVASMLPRCSADAKATLQRIAPDIVRHEQYLDFLNDRAFRMTLAVRADHKVDRNLHRDQIRDLHLCARLSLGDDGKFRTRRGTEIGAGRPQTHAALRALADRAPASMHFSELAAAVGGVETDLADDLMYCFLERVVEASLTPARCAARAGARPRVPAHVRHQATRGVFVTNLRHENIKLSFDIASLLPLLDGTRDRAALVELMEPGEREPAAVDWILDKLASHALLLC
jgi:methyltransferase-like protein/SAM-dependent methyltransferase